jgi:hypothetical protein
VAVIGLPDDLEADMIAERFRAGLGVTTGFPAGNPNNPLANHPTPEPY